MFTKNILVLLTVTLFSTTSVLAMNGEERSSRALLRLKEKSNQKNMKHKPAFERVVERFRDQVEHNRYMANFIWQKRQSFDDDQEFDESLDEILGPPICNIHSDNDNNDNNIRLCALI